MHAMKNELGYIFVNKYTGAITLKIKLGKYTLKYTCICSTPSTADVIAELGPIFSIYPASSDIVFVNNF